MHSDGDLLHILFLPQALRRFFLAVFGMSCLLGGMIHIQHSAQQSGSAIDINFLLPAPNHIDHFNHNGSSPKSLGPLLSFSFTSFLFCLVCTYVFFPSSSSSFWVRRFQPPPPGSTKHLGVKYHHHLAIQQAMKKTLFSSKGIKR